MTQYMEPGSSWTSLDFRLLKAGLKGGGHWGDLEESPVNQLLKPKTFRVEFEPCGPCDPCVETNEVPCKTIVIPKKTVTWDLAKKEKDLEEGEIDESDDETVDDETVDDDESVELVEPTQVLYPHIEFSIDDGDVSPQIWRPEKHGYCLFCNYKIHSNPPSHFNDQQRKHCCAWCETSKGRGHGQHCQRCP